jgi:hypothetical protein
MTKQLPATYVEAEALEVARRWIANCREGDFNDLGLPPLHRDAGPAFARRMLRHAMQDANSMLAILDLAYAGWRDARDALDDLIFECHNRGEPVPGCLVEYDTRVRKRQLPPIPPRLRGVRKSTNVLQDMFIVALIMELIVVCKLRPNRHQLYKSRPSACSVAAQAMTEAGLHRGDEKAVQKVWERYQASVLPGSRAEAVLTQLPTF